MLNNSVFSVVYLSFATRALDEYDIEQIIQASRVNNKKKGITGMLLYRHGQFLQLLEGSKPMVEDLMDTIAQDDRHSAITILSQGFNPRMFADWSMDYCDLSGVDLEDSHVVKADLLNEPWDSQTLLEQHLKVRRILLGFKTNPNFMAEFVD